MLACSLGDRRRGILNGKPNTELQAWRELGSAERLWLARSSQHGSHCPFQPDTALTRDAAPKNCSFPFSTPSPLH